MSRTLQLALAAFSFLTAVCVYSPVLAKEAGTIQVHLIGTGGPELTPKRQGISTLIEANEQRLLFDVGRAPDIAHLVLRRAPRRTSCLWHEPDQPGRSDHVRC
jgi:hypothetical protein